MASDMRTIAFFPWASATERLQFGRFLIAPLSLALEQPGVSPDDAQAVAHVLAPYHPRAVDRADVAVAWRDSEPFLSPLPDDAVAELFEFRSLVAFSGLAGREFFGHRYTNSETFRLVVQQFATEGHKGVTFVSRRRDGSSMNYVSQSTLRIPRPEHAPSAEVPRDIDAGLLTALDRFMSDQANDKASSRLADAIAAFVDANTDTNDRSLHGELVEIIGAFSRLFGAWDEAQTVAHFVGLVPPPSQADAAVAHRKTRGAEFYSFLEKNGPPRAAWLRDAYILRSQHAHGRRISPYPSKWTLREHLLLASFVFPLTVKLWLAERRGYELSDRELARVDAIESLVMIRPFDDYDDEHKIDPWREVLTSFSMRAWARLFYPSQGEEEPTEEG